MTSISLNAKALAVKEVGVEEFDNTYSDSAQYGQVQFWDAKYIDDPEPFEWYYGYDYFRDIVNESIPKKDSKVMIAGCGTSFFMEDMVADGYTDLLGVDISRVAIEIVKTRCKDTKEIKFLQGTMLDTDQPEHTFYAVIDKACFDSIICAGVGTMSIRQYLFEIDRLLTPDGVFIVVSHGNPEQRLTFLEQYDLDMPGNLSKFVII
jgi:SAM-dependent methyltransferase